MVITWDAFSNLFVCTNYLWRVLILHVLFLSTDVPSTQEQVDGSATERPATVILTVKDKPGALWEAINVFGVRCYCQY